MYKEGREGEGGDRRIRVEGGARRQIFVKSRIQDTD